MAAKHPPQDPKAPFGYTKSGKPRKRALKTGAPPKGGTKGPHGKSTTGRVQGVKVNQAAWRKKMQLRRIKFDDQQKKIYIAAMNDHALKGKSAQAANVSMQTVYDHLKNDPDFKQAFHEAIDAHADKIVAHHHKLLLEGEITRKYDKEGNCIEETSKHPIRLIELELKRVEPEYRDKQTIDLNATGGGVLVAPADISPEDWIKREMEENAAKKPPEGVDEKAK